MVDRTILVTGGAGYVGSQTCALLADAGYVPVVVDNLTRGHADLVKWGALEQGDVADPAFLDGVLARWRPAAVVHLAAYAYVGESVQSPGLYYRNNFGGGLTVLEAMQRHGIDKLVFSSTCSVYGAPDRMPIGEDTPPKPINPYGATKLAMEQAIAGFGEAFGLRAAVLRYFNVAGADPDGRCGERHDPEPHIIPNAIYTAFGRQENLPIFGSDYATADGTCIRDYIHVHDIGRAHVLGLERLLGGGESLTVNLATGRGYSVREVVAALERVTGRVVPLRPEPRRPGDPPILVADARRAEIELGWRPAYPAIDDMVAHAVAWARADGQV